MKLKNYYLIACFFIFPGITVFGQITYVNHAAGGSNNGSSWMNAYTSLSMALDNTNSGQIWVAQGVYTPAGGDSSATFRIQGVVEVYGGFDGSESNLADRDYANNLTILSGDIAGDDIQDDFDNNKTDNVQHVIYVDSLIGTPVVIDGFQIRGGHTSDFSGQDEYFFRGGGIFAYSTIGVANCDFTGNFGRSGACVYVSPEGGGGDGSSFENCNFYNNRSSSQSAGIFVRELDGVYLDNCTFTDNATVRGAFYCNFCTDVNLDNCLFENNETVGFADFGAAIFNWQSTGISISNSQFLNNVGGNGGVMYHDGAEAGIDANNLIFENCTFEGNVAQDWGGGVIYSFNASMTILDCMFNQNSAVNSGGHVFFGGTNKEVVVANTTFTNGSATFGGAHNCYGENSFFTLTGNTYTGNIAGTSGGAVINGFKADVNYDNCFFEENEAAYGGVMYLQNDTTNVVISNSSFKGNLATDGAGAINVSTGPNLSLSDSYFEANIGGDGGALFMGEFDAIEESILDLHNCIFNFNQASVQGGAISLSDIDATISNCLFMNNASPDGAGGAILNNVTDDNSSAVSIINTTIGNNASPIGAGIAQWTSDYNASTTMTLQNCLLSTVLGDNYEIEGGTPELLSNGGNVSDDLSTELVLTQATDVNDSGDPLFVDPFGFDFHVMAGSPAINAGIAVGAPEFDLDGNARVDAVDAGAYEYQGPVGVQQLAFEQGALTVYPNPVSRNAVVELENEWIGTINWQITDLRGVTIQTGTWEKNRDKFIEVMTFNDFASGVYLLLLEHEGQVMQKKLVRK
ncbi:MAG: T9SS type A sorting domain-containing protein [Saprospiraceae bacterium]|nr:T9SS type A sorting domain-containing protein [Saprospiraceae bacterium]